MHSRPRLVALTALATVAVTAAILIAALVFARPLSVSPGGARVSLPPIAIHRVPPLRRHRQRVGGRPADPLTGRFRGAVASTTVQPRRSTPEVAGTPRPTSGTRRAPLPRGGPPAASDPRFPIAAAGPFRPRPGAPARQVPSRPPDSGASPNASAVPAPAAGVPPPGGGAPAPGNTPGYQPTGN